MDIAAFNKLRAQLTESYVKTFFNQFITKNPAFDLVTLDDNQLIHLQHCWGDYNHDILLSLLYIKDKVSCLLNQHYKEKGYSNFSITFQTETTQLSAIVIFSLKKSSERIYQHYVRNNLENIVSDYISVRLNTLMLSEKVIKRHYYYAIEMTKNDTPDRIWNLLTNNKPRFHTIVVNKLQSLGYDCSVKIDQHTNRNPTNPPHYVVKIFLTIDQPGE